jgi:hypothetical protein
MASAAFCRFYGDLKKLIERRWKAPTSNGEMNSDNAPKRKGWPS